MHSLLLLVAFAWFVSAIRVPGIANDVTVDDTYPPLADTVLSFRRTHEMCSQLDFDAQKQQNADIVEAGRKWSNAYDTAFQGHPDTIMSKLNEADKELCSVFESAWTSGELVVQLTAAVSLELAPFQLSAEKHWAIAHHLAKQLLQPLQSQPVPPTASKGPRQQQQQKKK